MTSTGERLEDLNLTHEEVERLSEAFKKEEFRKLFLEYAEEISNPENRARYENEIRQLENERGMDVKFINPEPGYVIKTTVGGKMKAFINICKNNYIEKPSSVKKVGSDGRQGLSWSLPHSFSPPREEMDKTKEKCLVYDVVIHPDTFRMAETNSRFKKMVNDMAIEGICKQFDVELDTKNLKFPKMKYKGTAAPTVIRSRLPEDAIPKKTNGF
jgi:dynein assembly factor 2